MYTLKIVHSAVLSVARLIELKTTQDTNINVSTDCLRVKYKSFQRNTTNKLHLKVLKMKSHLLWKEKAAALYWLYILASAKIRFKQLSFAILWRMQAAFNYSYRYGLGWGFSFTYEGYIKYIMCIYVWFR